MLAAHQVHDLGPLGTQFWRDFEQPCGPSGKIAGEITGLGRGLGVGEQYCPAPAVTSRSNASARFGGLEQRRERLADKQRHWRGPAKFLGQHRVGHPEG
jgi:hypothetical protein